jgi:catechol 2,3-dioxygenase-like lactoylglutathione lyase family enzyme
MATKFLHTRIRVSDLEKSIDWYARSCGFQVHKRSDKSPAGNQIVHLALPGNDHMLELTYSPDYKVEFPEDLMHTCIGVDDIVDCCGKLEADGFRHLAVRLEGEVHFRRHENGLPHGPGRVRARNPRALSQLSPGPPRSRWTLPVRRKTSRLQFSGRVLSGQSTVESSSRMIRVGGQALSTASRARAPGRP